MKFEKTSKFRVHPKSDLTRIDVLNFWFENKREIDEVPEKLWRVHDKYYYLTDFIEKHPGGRIWIEKNRGTDITELFESHHIEIEKAKIILNKYFVKNAETKRNSRYVSIKELTYQMLILSRSHLGSENSSPANICSRPPSVDRIREYKALGKNEII